MLPPCRDRRCADRGRRWSWSCSILPWLPRGCARRALSRCSLEELTPRELDVLRCLAEGLPNKEIARQLAISEHTVKFHVNAILRNLGAQGRTEAVVRATVPGLINL